MHDKIVDPLWHAPFTMSGWANLALCGLLRSLMSCWIYCKHKHLSGKLFTSGSWQWQAGENVFQAKVSPNCGCMVIKSNEIYLFLITKIQLISYPCQKNKNKTNMSFLLQFAFVQFKLKLSKCISGMNISKISNEMSFHSFTSTDMTNTLVMTDSDTWHC